MSEHEQTNDLLKEFEAAKLESLDDHIQGMVLSAKSVFNELSRLIKSITLYGSDHQSSLNFRSRFFEVMTQVLTTGDRIVLEVQTYALVIADQVIYEDPKAQGNFIYQFYTDGIRELHFHRGITSLEIDQLLNIFLLDWSNPNLFEDDSVTMLWAQKFEHIQYVVATDYNEDTQEADEHLFNFTDELNRLSDYCHTAQSYISPVVSRLKLSAEREQQLQHLKKMNQRELLEKLITLSHATQSDREHSGGADRFVQLLEKLAQLFAQDGEMSELERLMRQALFVANPRQCEQLLECWAVPIFMQQVMQALKSHDHPQALSSLACIKLLGSKATEHIARFLGEVADSHVDVLTQMILPHIETHRIELCRVLRSADFLHAKKLIPLLYSSQSDELCITVFQTGWKHSDQGVRYEVLLNLPERLYSLPMLDDVLIEGLADSYSKIRTLSSYRLSKLRGSKACEALKNYLRTDLSQVVLHDLRKLYVALALMGEPREFFIDTLAQYNGFKLSSFARKGRDVEQSLLVALAVASTQAEEHKELERVANRKLVTGALNESAQWGLAYLQSSGDERDQMIYELFFRNQLTLPKKLKGGK